MLQVYCGEMPPSPFCCYICLMWVTQIISHPPVITIFIGGIPTIPSHGRFMIVLPTLHNLTISSMTLPVEQREASWIDGKIRATLQEFPFSLVVTTMANPVPIHWTKMLYTMVRPMFFLNNNKAQVACVIIPCPNLKYHLEPLAQYWIYFLCPVIGGI